MSARKDTAKNDAEIEVLLREIFQEMDRDLEPWPPRIESDIDTRQLMRMWGCPESTARGRVGRLADSSGGKWQWIRVRGAKARRGTMVLRRNESKMSKASHKSREKQVVQREKSPRTKTR